MESAEDKFPFPSISGMDPKVHNLLKLQYLQQQLFQGVNHLPGNDTAYFLGQVLHWGTMPCYLCLPIPPFFHR